jgi:hypothetical protein
MSRPVVRFLLPILLLAPACKPSSDDPPAPAVSPLAVPAEALSAIDTGTLMSYIRVLASDSLLGRAPGTTGEDTDVGHERAGVDGRERFGGHGKGRDGGRRGIVGRRLAGGGEEEGRGEQQPDNGTGHVGRWLKASIQ